MNKNSPSRYDDPESQSNRSDDGISRWIADWIFGRPEHTTRRLPETPPTPPPRRHRQLQSPLPVANIQQQGVDATRRTNRVSTASTLVDEEEKLQNTKVRYGPAPAHTARRYATQRIRLTHGNLVVDCPLPEKLFNAVPRKTGEFRTMRYTAVTCEPDEFPYKKYTLRQQFYKRETELFIVITMYNVKQ